MEYYKPKPNTAWTPEKIGAKLRALKEGGEKINSDTLNKQHHPLYLGIVNQPGGWKRMVTQAGFDPAKERGKGYRERKQ